MSQIKITINNSSSTADTVFRLQPYCGDKHKVCQRLSRTVDSMSADMEAISMSMYVDGGVGGVKATGTLTLASVVAGATAKVGSQTFTAVVSGATGNQFNVGGSDTLTAVNLVAAINANTSFAAASGGSVVTASNVGAVVTITPSAYGSTGNQIPIAGSTGDGTITASGTFLTGGVEPAANVFTYSGLI